MIYDLNIIEFTFLTESNINGVKHNNLDLAPAQFILAASST